MKLLPISASTFPGASVTAPKTRPAGGLLQSMEGITLVLLAMVCQPAWSAEQKFPGKGVVTLGSGPLPLLLHYIGGSQQPVVVKLRDLSYEPPDLARSKALKALATRPCGVGDQVTLASDPIAGQATGADALGIGGFSWLVSGTYSSDGRRWWFKGQVKPKDGPWDFDKKDAGARARWAEEATQLGAALIPGKPFDVNISGSLSLGIAGVCNLNSAGEALV